MRRYGVIMAIGALLGLPTVSVTTGRLTVSAAAGGRITSLALHGHVLVNVCAALS